MKYRKKPVVIEARKFDSIDDIEELGEWCGGNILKGYPFSMSENQSILIETLEGNMKAELGDYIIKGVQGEFYPCKPDVFEATYGPVGEEKIERERIIGWLSDVDLDTKMTIRQVINEIRNMPIVEESYEDTV